jgi:predicted Zn-dependent peptidase
MLNRTIQPHITEPTEFNLHLKPYRHFTLDNGTNVYAVEAGEQDVLMLELVFNAGNWYEDKNIIAGSANFLLKNDLIAK